MKNKDKSNFVSTANSGSTMPDVVYISNNFVIHMIDDGIIQLQKYHADHIVQRLEAEKAELMEVLRMAVEHAGDYDTWEIKAQNLIKKHKG